MNSILNIIWLMIQLLLVFNLTFPLILKLLYFLTKKEDRIEISDEELDFAVVITAFEQTDLIIPAVNSVLSSLYQNFLVYVVADKCDLTGIDIADKRVILLRPNDVLASNTASHFYAIDNFQRNHTHLVIVDADNLATPNFLDEISVLIRCGYKAVQGMRKPKNLDTSLSRLDAARDLYYHFYDGKLLFGSGSSATLAGSGMAFKLSLYRDCFQNSDRPGLGFDKILQYEIVKRGYRIAYAEKAIIYDEKTSTSDQLLKQRARWLSTWFNYFNFGFALIIKGIVKRSINQFLFGLTLLRPPLFIFVLLSLLCIIANLWISLVYSFFLTIAFILFITGFILAVVRNETDKRILQALKGIPAFMFFQVLSLIYIKKLTVKNTATKHLNKVTINDIH